MLDTACRRRNFSVPSYSATPSSLSSLFSRLDKSVMWIRVDSNFFYLWIRYHIFKFFLIRKECTSSFDSTKEKTQTELFFVIQKQHFKKLLITYLTLKEYKGVTKVYLPYYSWIFMTTQDDFSLILVIKRIYINIFVIFEWWIKFKFLTDIFSWLKKNIHSFFRRWVCFESSSVTLGSKSWWRGSSIWLLSPKRMYFPGSSTLKFRSVLYIVSNLRRPTIMRIGRNTWAPL